jgi:stage V sporulation protein AC
VQSPEQKLIQIERQEYEDLASQFRPKPKLARNLLWAFVVGGLICTLGQWMVNLMVGSGVSLADASSAASCILIFLAALTTGLGYYNQLGQRAGAGSIVPITGFANAIVASALEFKREGDTLGVGARIFAVAGPTLVFGFVVAVLMGLIKVFLTS